MNNAPERYGRPRTGDDLMNNNDFWFNKSGAERRELKKYGTADGLAMLGYVLLGNVILSVLLRIPAVVNLYSSEPMFSISLDCIMSVIYIGLPFLLALGTKKRYGYSDRLAFSMPKDKGRAALLIIMGLGACIAGSYATQYFSYFIEYSTGVTFSYTFFERPAGVLGMAIYFVRVAVIPPITEEFAMRKVVMDPLRRYGGAFAMVVSAIMFGLLHGNMVQLPFAIIAGCAIAYADLQTGSLLPGMAIHFLNNFFSIVEEVMAEGVPDEKQFILLLPHAAMLLAGVICAVVYFGGHLSTPLKRPDASLSRGKKTSAYFLNPAMLFAVIIMLFQTFLTTSLGEELLERVASFAFG